jgi:hypothetical protein
VTLVREMVEQVASMLDDLYALWKQFTMEEPRELLHLLIDQIVVDFSVGGLRVEFHDFCMPCVALPLNGDESSPFAKAASPRTEPRPSSTLSGTPAGRLREPQPRAATRPASGGRLWGVRRLQRCNDLRPRLYS